MYDSRQGAMHNTWIGDFLNHASKNVSELRLQRVIKDRSAMRYISTYIYDLIMA